MRILYLTQGVTAHDRRFLVAMADHGLEVGFVRLAPGPGDLPVLPGVVELSPGDPGDAFYGGGLLSRRRWLRQASQAFQPQVIHAGPVHTASFLAAFAGARPLISMSWGSDVLWETRRWGARARARYAFRRSQLLLCDCQAVRSRAIGLGMPDDRIVVFPWGVDLELYRPRPGRAPVDGRRRTVTLVSARSLEPIYGPEILIEGFLHAWRSQPELRLILLGDGSLRQQLEERVTAAGAAAAVRFEGAVEEESLADRFADADLYVSASRSDGSSVSLLQAMACGLPAMVSDLPPNREWVVDGQNGWLFEDGSPQSLARTIQRALREGSRWPAFGAASRAVTERQADWRRNQQLLMDAYEMVARGG